MKSIFLSYASDDLIPALAQLRNRKLIKYFNRETAAAIVAVGTLLKGESLSPLTPVYYATGILEYEDYGLMDVVNASADEAGSFSFQAFIDHGMSAVSPLNQFKVLQNMPLCFVSIENNLHGDNAVIYSSSKALLAYASASPWSGPIIIGAGKVYNSGAVDVAFALASAREFTELAKCSADSEGVEIFRKLATRESAI